LQRSRPDAEPRIELYRDIARITDRALDLLEVAHCEVVALLQIEALLGGFAGNIGRNCRELVPEPGGEVSKLALPPAHLLQPFDQSGALPVSFFE
jgi:hypothetical protein